MIIIAILAVISGLFVLWISFGITKSTVKEKFYKTHPELTESFINNTALISGIIGFILIMCGIYILI